MRVYYRYVDHSIWRQPPPDEHRVIDGIEAKVIEDALSRGEIPRIENDQLRIYVPSAPPLDVVMRAVRHERDLLLAQSDWTQAADAELTLLKKKAWADYRRALRRVPQQFPTGRNVVWPIKPE